MLKVAVVLFFFSFLVQPLLADPSGLEVRLINEKRKEMVAGSTSNVLVMLVNNTDTIKQIQLKLNVTGNTWRQIADYSSALVEKNSVLNKIITLHIPDNTKSGDYSIELEAFEASAIQPFGKVNIPIYVKPRYEILVNKQNASGYLLSGDSLSVQFLIRNLSNLDVTVEGTVINGGKLESRSFRIPMDSSIITNVSVSTQKGTSYYSKQNITLTASISGKPETESSDSYLIDIIPSNNAKFDGYNRFPVKISGLLTSTNRLGEREYGTMFDILGSGLLNESKNRKLEFHFRGPDQRGNPLLGLNDEYYINYIGSRTKISIGDNNYRLSDLTESSRNGRGLEVRHAFGKLAVGSFFHFPRYYPGIKQIFSFYTELMINPNIRFLAGYLNKTNNESIREQLVTFSGAINPFSWLKSEFELAAGQHQDKITKAYRVSLNVNSSFLASHFSFTHADPDFIGYVSDSRYISSGITANLTKKLSLSVNYNLNRTNLSLDTIYANVPYSQNINAITSLRMSPNNSLSIGAFMTVLEDRAAVPLFNNKAYSGKISLQTRFSRINLGINAEYGKAINLLGVENGKLTDFYNGNFTLKYSFNKSISATGFVNYRGGQQYLLTDFHRFYYGGSLQTNLNKKSYISFDYRNNYELNEYYRDRSLLSLQMHQQVFSNHEIDLGINYNLVKNSLDKKELSILVRYTYTLNIPISRKKDVGKLTGKVINVGVDKVDGILFNLNGNIAITDKNGNFEFPMVKVGTYILAMDESSAGLNTITEVPGPYRVKIEPGRETQFEISLTRSARIFGRLVIREDDKKGKKGFYPVKEEIESIIIEASNGTEIFRQLTRREGIFSFEDLRPGNWHIRVYPNGIPQGYKLEKDQFDINLPMGKEENLEVIINKKSREIKLQNKF